MSVDFNYDDGTGFDLSELKKLISQYDRVQKLKVAEDEFTSVISMGLAHTCDMCGYASDERAEVIMHIENEHNDDHSNTQEEEEELNKAVFGKD